MHFSLAVGNPDSLSSAPETVIKLLQNRFHLSGRPVEREGGSADEGGRGARLLLHRFSHQPACEQVII